MMEDLGTWKDIMLESMGSFGTKVMEGLPSIFGAIMIFIIGWVVARLFKIGVAKLLRLLKFDTLADKVGVTEYFKKGNIKNTPSQILAKFMYWVILLLVMTTAAETLGWDMLSNEISRLITYLPKLLLAIVLFIVGTYIASIVRDVIAGTTQSLGISAGRFLSKFAYYLLMVVVSLTALKQAGVDTAILTSNVLLVMGAILAAAAISYGFASREILTNILASYYASRLYKKGMHIAVDDIKGEIISIHSVGLIIKTTDGKQITIPAKEMIENRITIVDATIRES